VWSAEPDNTPMPSDVPPQGCCSGGAAGRG
jgi:hypothetical protein